MSVYSVAGGTANIYASQHPLTPSSDASNSSTGSLRTARSTPDLARDVDRAISEDVIANRRHVLLPRPSSVGSVEEIDTESQTSSHRELGQSRLLLVSQMIDMGFPRSRVIRAVQAFGTDDKKIVEHLCSVQSLVESGFEDDKVAAALFLHGNDEDVAREFLHLSKQFRDLGFEEDAIKHALTLHKNDRDKALDYLIS